MDDRVTPPAPGIHDPGAAARFATETDLRRLRRELALRDEATRDLTRRLRDAEQEAATASGATVEAMRAELDAWRSRATAAEAELAAVRATKFYRAAAPLMAVYRVRRRLPGLVGRVLHRLG